MSDMLQFQHLAVVDSAFQLKEREIVFTKDASSTDFIDVGILDVADCSIKRSDCYLAPYQQRSSTAPTPQHHTDGILSCKSKLIVYTANGLFSCYDTLSKRVIFSRGLNNMGCKSSKMNNLQILSACVSRAEDELFFFSLKGDNSVYALYFTGRSKRGQHSNVSCEAYFAPPIKVDPRAVDKGLATSKEGIISMTCHSTLPYIIINGMGGVYVWCYSNLLRRLNAQSANSNGSADGPMDESNNNQEDENENESESGSGVASNSDKSPRRKLSGSLFRKKNKDKYALPDFVLTGILAPPKNPKIIDSKFPASPFKMCIHSGGAFAGIVWTWGSVTAEPGVTAVCVYDIRLPAILLAPQVLSPLTLNPIATNNMNRTGQGTKSREIHAIFSLCFHATEPILILGMVLRVPEVHVANQTISICSLSLLEPSMRLLGIQNIKAPLLQVHEKTEKREKIDKRKGLGINRIVDCHATDILCDTSGAFILLSFKHTTITLANWEHSATRALLRPMTIVTYTLGEDWRKLHGCCSSLSITTQLSIPMGTYKIDHKEPDPRFQSGTGTLIPGSRSMGNVTYSGRTILAVRPLGSISLSGEIRNKNNLTIFQILLTLLLICTHSYFSLIYYVIPEFAGLGPLKYSLPMFLISLTGNGSPSSVYIGDIPTLADNKTVGTVGSSKGLSGGKRSWIDLAVSDRLAPCTDGPFLPTVLKLLINSRISTQDPHQNGDFGSFALVRGVRGFPPKGIITPQTTSTNSYRIDFSGKNEEKEIRRTFLADNQMLNFVSTVCVIRFEIPGKQDVGSNNTANASNVNDTSKNRNNSNSNSAKTVVISESSRTFQSEFVDWLDADFWTDPGPNLGLDSLLHTQQGYIFCPLHLFFCTHILFIYLFTYLSPLYLRLCNVGNDLYYYYYYHYYYYYYYYYC